jgi:hypothetical protein
MEYIDIDILYGYILLPCLLLPLLKRYCFSRNELKRAPRFSFMYPPNVCFLWYTFLGVRRIGKMKYLQAKIYFSVPREIIGSV